MSATAIIIIFLVVCMALGPVFLLQPSRRQRQLAQYRAWAAKAGIKVRVTELAGEPYAVYSASWPGTSARKFTGPEVQLFKKDYTHELHIEGVWESKPQTLTAPIKQALTAFVNQMPESVSALSATSEGFAIYWKELGGEAGFNQIQELLKQGAEVFWPLLSVVKSSADELRGA